MQKLVSSKFFLSMVMVLLFTFLAINVDAVKPDRPGKPGKPDGGDKDPVMFNAVFTGDLQGAGIIQDQWREKVPGTAEFTLSGPLATTGYSGPYVGEFVPVRTGGAGRTFQCYVYFMTDEFVLKIKYGEWSKNNKTKQTITMTDCIGIFNEGTANEVTVSGVNAVIVMTAQ